MIQQSVVVLGRKAFFFRKWMSLFRVDTVVAGIVWGARGTTANAFLFGFILFKQTRASYFLSPFIF